MTRLVLFKFFVTNLLLFEYQRKPARQLTVFWTLDVTKYGSGWRKDVNQCLEFALTANQQSSISNSNISIACVPSAANETLTASCRPLRHVILRVRTMNRDSIKFRRTTVSTDFMFLAQNVNFFFFFLLSVHSKMVVVVVVVVVVIVVVVVVDSFLYSAILRSRADSLRWHVILHEWLAFYRAFFTVHRSGVLTALAWLVPRKWGLSQRSYSLLRVQARSKGRKVVLDPQVSPEEIENRGGGAGLESRTSFALTASQRRSLRTLSLWLCPA